MNEVVLESRNVTLVETLDRVLNKGVIISGDVTISVADVDLIFVGLKVLLASVETAEKMHCGYRRYEYDRGNGGKGESETNMSQENNENVIARSETSHLSLRGTESRSNLIRFGAGSAILKDEIASPSVRNDGKEVFSEQPEEIKAVLPRIDAEPEKVEQGLAKLVLTLIDLIRKLMEKQAIRRIDGGSLSDKEVEKLGYTFMRLENKMEELRKVFGLKDEDLNLNLGPLGNLM